MMPTIELRLATMRRALVEVILPAIDAGNALAREQAQLLIAHLDLLERQVADAPRLDAAVLRGTRALATELAARAAGGDRTQAAATALRKALAQDEVGSAADCRARLAAAIDVLVDALYADGEADCRAFACAAIVDHAVRDGVLERAWFAANGLDPERASLPPLNALLAAG